MIDWSQTTGRQMWSKGGGDGNYLSDEQLKAWNYLQVSVYIFDQDGFYFKNAAGGSIFASLQNRHQTRRQLGSS